MNIAEAIRRAMKENHIVQKTLAETLGYKSQSGVSQRLNASDNMLASNLLKFTNACGYRLWIVPNEIEVDEGLEITHE